MQARHRTHFCMHAAKRIDHVARVLNITVFQHHTSQTESHFLSLHQASEGGPRRSLDFIGNEIDSGRLNNLPKVKKLIRYRIRVKTPLISDPHFFLAFNLS